MTNIYQITDCKGLLVFGCGGHARSVADVALALGISNICFFDKNARAGEELLNHPVTAKQWDKLPPGWCAFPASGSGPTRQHQVSLLDRFEWPLATLVAPSATVGAGSTIGRGSFIGHHAHVGPIVDVGIGCIINTAAVVEHECKIGDFSHISVNSSIAGRSAIGSMAFIGAGSSVIDNLQIGDRITVGAGSVVVDSLYEEGTYVGQPVRRVGTK